jgi:hypothetical protein
MIPIRNNYWLWLALATGVFAYGLISGGGPIGWLLYWEVETFGIIFSETYVVVAFLLFVVPVTDIAKQQSRRSNAHLDIAAHAKLWGRRNRITGLILAGVAGLSFFRTILLPSPDAPPQRLVLDDISPAAAVPEHKSILVGTPQRKYGVRYTEAVSGRFSGTASYGHNFIPITRSAWTPDQPVRFLVDTDGNSVSSFFSREAGGQRYVTDSGLLLRGKLPVFVRRALQKNGVLIADDVMLLSSGSDFGRLPWYLVAAFSSIGTFVFLLIGFVMPWAWAKPAKEMAALAPRIARYFAFGLGGAIILLSAVLAIQKIVHITASASAEGVITSTLTNSHDFGKYSYFVEYTTPAGHYQRQALTSTPISKDVGDTVVLIYDRRDPGSPEILIFDSDWILYLIILLPGAVIVMLGGILFRPRKKKSPLIVVAR